MLIFKSFLETDAGSEILKYKAADTDFSSSLWSHTYSLGFFEKSFAFLF